MIDKQGERRRLRTAVAFTEQVNGVEFCEELRGVRAVSRAQRTQGDKARVRIPVFAPLLQHTLRRRTASRDGDQPGPSRSVVHPAIATKLSAKTSVLTLGDGEQVDEGVRRAHPEKARGPERGHRVRLVCNLRDDDKCGEGRKASNGVGIGTIRALAP